EGFHGVDHHPLVPWRQLTSLTRGGENSVADWFGQNDLIARLCAGVREQKIRMCPSRHRQSVFELRVDDCVAADNQRSGFMNFFLPASQNLAEDFERQLACGERHDVERGEWLATHRVYVGQRVGGRDL